MCMLRLCIWRESVCSHAREMCMEKHSKCATKTTDRRLNQMHAAVIATIVSAICFGKSRRTRYGNAKRNRLIEIVGGTITSIVRTLWELKQKVSRARPTCVCVWESRVRRCCGHIEWAAVVHAWRRCVCKDQWLVAAAGVDRFKLSGRYFPLLFEIVVALLVRGNGRYCCCRWWSCVYTIAFHMFIFCFILVVSFVFFSCVFAVGAVSSLCSCIQPSSTCCEPSHSIDSAARLLCHSNQTDLLQSVVVLRSE